MFKLRLLEDRIVLDGAAFLDAVDEFNDHEEHARQLFQADAGTNVQNWDYGLDADTPLSVGDADEAGARVLVVSSNLEDADDLAAAADDDVTVVRYDASETSANELAGMIEDALGGQKASSIAFAAHGAEGALSLTGDDTFTSESLDSNEAHQTFWRDVGALLSVDGRIDLMACDVAGDDGGLQFVSQLEDLTGADVAASIDATGNPSAGGDWTLEHGGIDVTDVYFDASEIDAYDGLMDPITVENPMPDYGFFVGEGFSILVPNDYPDDFVFRDPAHQETLSFYKSGNPSWLSWNASTHTFTAADGASTAGTWEIRVIAYDGTYTADDYFNLNIADTGGEPVANYSMSEYTVNETGTEATVTVELSEASGSQVTVDYSTSDGTAVQGSDYTSQSGQLTFSPYTTSQSFTVPITNDFSYEGSESFSVNLTTASGAVLGSDSVASVTIVDNESASVSFAAQTSGIGEGDSGSTSHGVDVQLSVSGTGTGNAQIANDLTVTVTDDGTGTADSADYTTFGSASLTFGAGALSGESATFTIDVTGDTTAEENDTIDLSLSGPAGVTIGQGAHTVYITNDDVPNVNFETATFSGGESSGSAIVTVTLDASPFQQATVDYATSNGTAGSLDYTNETGTLTFDPGVTLQTFSVSISQDARVEGTESFNVSLSNWSGADPGTQTAASVDIVDDETATVNFQYATSSVTEGTGATVYKTVYAELDLTSPGGGTPVLASGNDVNATISAVDGTAVSGDDYTATQQVITFTGGSASDGALKSFQVAVTGDSLDEADENLTLQLTSLSANTVASAQSAHTMTIIDDDDATATVAFQTSSIATAESSAGFDVTVTLSEAAGQDVYVTYATADGTATTAGSDYTAITGDVLTFAAGTTVQTFHVDVTNDSLVEPSETFNLTLSNAQNAILGTSVATATITDNEAASVSFEAATSSADEAVGNHPVNAVLTLTGNGTVSLQDSATIDVTDLGTGDATAGDDYTSFGTTQLAFAAGSQSGAAETFNLAVTDDSTNEPAETVDLALTNPSSNLTISGTSAHTVTITDNDAAVNAFLEYTTFSVNEGAGSVIVSVSLSAASGQDVTVNYATGDGTAVQGEDYGSTSGNVFFDSTLGETLKTFSVSVTDDAYVEMEQTFNVSLTGATNATITQSIGTVTIVDNDSATVSFQYDTSSFNEGNSGSTPRQVNLLLTTTGGSVQDPLTVDVYDTGNGTADAGTDYEVFSTTQVSFTGSSNGSTIPVDLVIIGDEVIEADETLELGLSNVTGPGAIGGPSVHTLTITNDEADPQVSFSMGSYSVSEDGPTVVVTATLSQASAAEATVDYSTADGTAFVSGSDYSAITSGTLTFAPFDQVETFAVTINDDGFVEGDETFNVNLSNPVNATLTGAANTVATITITDDESASVGFSVATSSLLEGDATTGATEHVVTVTLDLTGDAAGLQLENYTVDGYLEDLGTGSADSADYTTFTAQSFSFATGSTDGATKTFGIDVQGDDYYETADTIDLAVTSISAGASGAQTLHTVTIENDDAVPTVSLETSTFSGAEADGFAIVTLSLSAVAGQDVTVDLAYTDTTAWSGVDYYETATATITQGQTVGTFSIAVENDRYVEMDEAFTVELSSATGADVGGQSLATVTITDNDMAYVGFNLESSSVTEGNVSHQVYVDLTLVTDGATTSPAELQDNLTMDLSYTTTGVNDATADSDFTAFSTTQLTFGGGLGSGAQTYFSLEVLDDSLSESDENVGMTLGNVSDNGMLTTSGFTTHTVNIVDNEPDPSINFSSATYAGAEDPGGSASVTSVVTVTLSGTADTPVTVNYSKTGNNATAGQDFAGTSGELTFDPGVTSQTFAVTILEDARVEGDETLTLDLTSFTGSATWGTTSIATFTIGDDESADVNFQTATSSALEGDASNTTFAVNAQLDITSSDGTPLLQNPISVNVADTGNGDAVAGTDYVSFSPDTLTFAGGSQDGDIMSFGLEVIGDVNDEPDVTVELSLTGATGSESIIAPSIHTVTIVDNDATPEAYFMNTAATISEDGSSSQIFTVALTGQSAQDVTVDYSVISETTTPDSDYQAISTTALTFAAGETAQTFTVTSKDDSLLEGDESLTLGLSNGQGAVIGAASAATLTITDEETATVEFSAASSSVSEGNTGTADHYVDVNVIVNTADGTGEIGNDLTVDVTDQLTGDADSGTDYAAVGTQTVTIVAGTTTGSFALTVNGDTLSEADETVNVELSNPSAGAIGTTSVHTVTIADDDDGPDISFTTQTVSVGEGATSQVFNVELSTAAGQDITVDWNAALTSGGIDQGDLGLYSGTFTAFAGQTTASFEIQINDDGYVESNEIFDLSLANPSTGQLVASSVSSMTIVDNDSATIGFSTDTSSFLEGTSTTGATTSGTANLVLTLSGGATQIEQPVTVWLSNSGDAIEGDDYTLTASTVTFPADAGIFGDDVQTFTVDITQDSTGEPDENVILEISSISGAGSVDAAASMHTMTILNDDEPTVSFASATYAETENNSPMAAITVNLSEPSDQAVTVWYSASAGTADEWSDYDPPDAGSSVSFAAGQTAATINIQLNDDAALEGDETLSVELGTATNATVGGTTLSTLTITDDDLANALVSFKTATSAVSESGGQAIVTMVLDMDNTDGSPILENTGITVEVTDVTPTTAGYADSSDYTTFTSESVTFSTGSIDLAEETFAIAITSDTNDEPNYEDIVLEISSVSAPGSIGATSVHSMSIMDDDDAPTVSFDTATGYSDTEGLDAVVTLNLSAASNQTVSVDYTLTGVEAVEGVDYNTPASYTVTFGPSVTTATFLVSTIDDDLIQPEVEGDETIAIALTNPSNAELGTVSDTTLTIIDDEFATVGFEVATSAFNEGDSGSTFMPVNILLEMSKTDAILGDDVSVEVFDYETGTADAGGTDYQTIGTATVVVPSSAGHGFTQQLNVDVVGDTGNELDETIDLELGSVTAGPAVAGGVTAHTLTILNDDVAPTANFAMATYAAAEGTDTFATITLTLDQASSQEVYVNIDNVGGSADTSDYTSFTDATVTFGVGETQQVLTFAITDDIYWEAADETVNLELATGDTYQVGTTQSTATLSIASDETASISFATATASIGEANAERVNVQLTLTGDGTPELEDPIDVTLNESGGGTADGAADYGTFTALTQTFAAGAVSTDMVSFNLNVVDDGIDEVNETVNVHLSQPVSPVTMGTQTAQTVSIIDDDPATTNVGFEVSTYSVGEESGPGVVTVTLDSVSEQEILVKYQTSNGTAASGSDYGFAFKELTFAAGVTAQTFGVTITSDGLLEGDETLNIDLLTPENAVLGTSTATMTIIDNEEATIEFSAATSSVVEGNTGDDPVHSLNAKLVMTGNGTLQLQDDMSFTVTDPESGSAEAGTGSDYFTIGTETLTFNAGSGNGAEVAFTFQVDSDDVDELDAETVNLELGTVTAGLDLGTANTVHTVSILDDDAAPFVSFESATNAANEGDTDTTAVINVVFEGGAISDRDITVDLSASDGAATGADYAMTTSQVTIAAGNTTASFAVDIVGDTAVENDETVNLAITGTNAQLGAVTASELTIIDNDNATISFDVGTSTVGEGNVGHNVVVSLDTGVNPLQTPITLTVTNSGQTATPGTDYDFSDVTITFPKGASTSTQNVQVTIYDDGAYDPDETIDLSIVSVTGPGDLTTSVHTVTIIDDENAPQVQFDSATYAVIEDGGPMGVVTLTLDTPSDNDAVVELTLTDVDTTVNSDYDDPFIKQVTFSAGNTIETFGVQIREDSFYEGSEDFTIELSTISGVELGTTTVSTMTITDDETASVGFALASSSFDESVSSAGVNVQLTISGDANARLEDPLNVTVTDVTPTGPNYADDTSDYAAFTSAVLTFGANSLTGSMQTHSITINEDTYDEVTPEEISLELSSATAGASIGQSTHSLFIEDNDASPEAEFSLAASTISASETGGAQVFTVTLNNPSLQTASVDYLVIDNDTTTGDYTLESSTTLTFDPNVTSQTFSIGIEDDSLVEGDEDFTVQLTNPVEASITTVGISEATVTITDNEAAAVVFSNALSSVAEGDSGTTAHGVNVSLVMTGTTTSPITLQDDVTVDVLDVTTTGNAEAGTDYVAFSVETLTFAAGSGAADVQTFTLTVNGDTVDETDETVSLELGNVTGDATLGVASVHTATIVDDESVPTADYYWQTINEYADGDASSLTNGAFIADVDAVGGSGPGPIVYSIENVQNGAFTIDSGTGLVTIGDATLVDYETAITHTLKIGMDDGDNMGYTFVFVQVNDLDEGGNGTGSDHVVEMAIPDQTVARGDDWIYQVPDGTFTPTVTYYSVSGMPSWLQFDSTSKTFWTFNNTDTSIGSYSITVNANYITGDTGAAGAETISDTFELYITQLERTYLDALDYLETSGEGDVMPVMEDGMEIQEIYMADVIGDEAPAQEQSVEISPEVEQALAALAMTDQDLQPAAPADNKPDGAKKA